MRVLLTWGPLACLSVFCVFWQKASQSTAACTWSSDNALCGPFSLCLSPKPLCTYITRARITTESPFEFSFSKQSRSQRNDSFFQIKRSIVWRFSTDTGAFYHKRKIRSWDINTLSFHKIKVNHLSVIAPQGICRYFLWVKVSNRNMHNCVYMYSWVCGLWSSNPAGRIKIKRGVVAKLDERAESLDRRVSSPDRNRGRYIAVSVWHFPRQPPRLNVATLALKREGKGGKRGWTVM